MIATSSAPIQVFRPRRDAFVSAQRAFHELGRYEMQETASDQEDEQRIRRAQQQDLQAYEISDDEDQYEPS